MSSVYSTRSSRQSPMVWGWACRSAARLSKRTAAACGLLPTPLGELYFSSFSALRLRHQPLLLDDTWGWRAAVSRLQDSRLGGNMSGLQAGTLACLRVCQ